MAFDKKTLGALGNTLPSDTAGRVPEDGDGPEQFTWEAGREWTEDAWQAYVADAVKATAKARAMLERWRNESMGGFHA